MVVDQVVPDRHRVATQAERADDEVAIRLAGAGGRRALRLRCARRRTRVGGHLPGGGRFCRLDRIVGVGGHPLRGGRCWRPHLRPSAPAPHRDARRLQIRARRLSPNAGGFFDAPQRPAQVARAPVICCFLSSAKTLLMSARHGRRHRRPRQRLGALAVVAGFQVSISGRIWVSTEARRSGPASPIPLVGALLPVLSGPGREKPSSRRRTLPPCNSASTWPAGECTAAPASSCNAHTPSMNASSSVSRRHSSPNYGKRRLARECPTFGSFRPCSRQLPQSKRRIYLSALPETRSQPRQSSERSRACQRAIGFLSTASRNRAGSSRTSTVGLWREFFSSVPEYRNELRCEQAAAFRGSGLAGAAQPPRSKVVASHQHSTDNARSRRLEHLLRWTVCAQEPRNAAVYLWDVRPTTDMNDSETTVCEYLKSLRIGSVRYEPDGNVPPDFLVDGRVAVEARRLNEHEEVNGIPRGLEVTAKPLHRAMVKALRASGPPDGHRSW